MGDTLKLTATQVIGLNTDQKAAQVASLIRDGDNAFFAVLDLSCDDAFTKGRQILSDLSDFYFEFEGSASEKLNATFEEAGKKFQNEEHSILLSGISGKVLYLISKGTVEVYLKRGEKLLSLLTGHSSQLISGFLQVGDKMLLSTSSLVSFLGDDLDKSFDLSLENFETEITDRIGSSDLENQGLAGLLIHAQEEKVVGEEPADVIPSLNEDENEYQEKPVGKNPLAILGIILSIIKNIFVKTFPKSGRGRLILAVVLIVIIAFGVGFKVKASKDAEKQAKFSSAMQKANDDFNSAKGLASLNPLEAKGKLDSAKAEVSQALSLKPKDNEAQNLQKQINDESGTILKQSEASNFPEFLDLDLVKKNFRATQMSLSAGKLLILDPTVGTLVTIDLEKKSNQILAGSEQLGETIYSSLNGTLAFVFSKDKGLLRVDSANKKVTTVSKLDKDWGDVKDLYGFGGNIYVLDLGNPSTSSGMIWKYLPTSEGYSDKREYLAKDVKADFANSIRMQIESSVYILKSGGEILRFTKGVKDNFGLQGLDKGIKDPKSIFVSSDTEDFYILDSGNSRLVILTKIGSYKSQISGEKFGIASDLVVDEKGKKVYLLDGSKIYTADLK